MAGNEWVIRVTGDVRDVLASLRATEQQAASTGNKIGQSLTKGLDQFKAKSANGLASELERISRIQGKVRVDGAGFEQLEKRAQAVRAAVEAIERKKLLITADVSSIAALQNRLQTLNGELARVAIGSREFRKLQGEIRGVEQQLGRAGEAGGIAARGVSAFRTVLGSLAGLAAGVSVAGFFQSSIDSAVELESISRKLANTLGPQGAQSALSFSRKLSDELGLSFTTLASNFGSFTAAATAANVPLEQQRGLFAAVAKAGQALGLSNDEIGGSLLALQQVASKGTVAMEELRGQLGERLPIALAATARGLGLSQKELIKLVESGQLSAGDFFPALTKGLNELTSAAGGVPTAAQNFQQLANAWKELQIEFGTNLLPTVIAGVQKLIESFKEFQVQNRGKKLGLDRGPFGGLSNQNAQLVGELDRLQKQFNLTNAQADKLFLETAQGAGAARDRLGNLNLTEEQRSKILDTLQGNVQKYAAANRDAKAEALALAAAESARLEGLKKQADAQQKVIAGVGRTNRLEAIRAEVGQIQRLIQGTISQGQIEEEQYATKRKALQEEIKAYDVYISKLEAAGTIGAEYQKALEARGQVVLAAAQNEADAFRKTEERVKARIAQERELANAIRARPGQVASDQIQVGQALVSYAQAINELEQSRLSLTVARGQRELSDLERSGASQAQLAAKRQQIEQSEREGAVLRYQGLLQVQALEARILALKQQQAQSDAQAGLLDAQKELLIQQQELAKAQKTGDQEAIQRQQAIVSLSALGVDLAARRLGVLQSIAPVEKAALLAQQESARNGQQAEAITKGWADQLGSVDASFQAVRQTAVLAKDGIYDLVTVTQDQNAAAGSLAGAYDQVGDPAQAISQFLQSSEQSATNLQGQMFKVSEAAGASATTVQTMASAMGTAAENAKRFYDYLLQAASVPQGRFTGGPVEAGTAYRVNELGREAFLSSAGRLTEINRPANGLWTPPSSGTVIPAGITAQLKERGLLQRGSGLAAGLRSDGGMGAMAAELGMLRQEVRALRHKDWSVGVRVINEAGGATLIDRMNSLI